MVNRPALLDVVVSPEVRSSEVKTGLAWVRDLQPLAASDDPERTWRANARHVSLRPIVRGRLMGDPMLRYEDPMVFRGGCY